MPNKFEERRRRIHNNNLNLSAANISTEHNFNDVKKSFALHIALISKTRSILHLQAIQA